jgi:nucleoside-diphosphate-sugar epimerase
MKGITHLMKKNEASPKTNVVILGATGFIGRNLALKFCNNSTYSVTLIHHNSPKYKIQNANWIKADLRNIKEVQKVIKKSDIVIQAAATTSGASDIVNNPEIHVTDNAIMNSLILRESYHKKVRHVIFFSCTTMYNSNSTKKQKEEDYDSNLEVYPRYFGVAETKLYIEKLCKFYASISETKFTVIRHTNVYGPWDKYDLQRSHVLGATITKVMLANDSINIWGDGSEIRDLLYIDDLVELVEKSLDNQKCKHLLINAGSDQGISVANLVEMVIEESQKNLEITFDDSKPTLKYSFIADSSKALKELGWQSKTPLRLGIQKSINWWRQNSDYILNYDR